MKNRLSTMMCDMINFSVCIGLAFGLTACGTKKQNPTAALQSAQIQSIEERNFSTSTESPVENKATVIPSTNSEKTPENGNANSDNGNITITFATYETMESFYIPMMEEFHRENPLITVNFVSFPELTQADYTDRLNVARIFASSADTIDFDAIFDNAQYPTESSFVQDLRPLIDQDELFKAEDFWPGALTGCQDTQGRILGIPIRLNPRGIFYDEQAFRDAGLALPEPGWTWDDFRNDTARLAEQNQGAVRYGFAEHGNPILTQMLEQHLAKTGGDIPVQNIANDVQWYLDLARQKALYPIQVTGNGDAANQAEGRWHELFQGKNRQPAMWNGFLESYDPAIIPGNVSPENDPYTHLAIDRFGFAPFPVNADGSSTKNSPIIAECVSISAGSTHIQAAWAWLKFLSEHPPAGERVKLFEQLEVPARQSVTDESGFWNTLPAKNRTSVRYILENGWYYGGLYNTTIEAISAALVKTVTGNADFVSALTDEKAKLEKTPQAAPDSRPIVINTPKSLAEK